MLTDFKQFTLLEKVVCFVDLLINPNALDYPISYTDLNPRQHTRKPFGHLVTVKEVNNNGRYKIIYLRWI